MNANEARRLLYVCTSYLTLVGAVILQMNENAGIPADVLLLDTVYYADNTADLMKNTGLFEPVGMLACAQEIEVVKKKNGQEATQRAMVALCGRLHMPWKHAYTDMYTNFDTPYSKLAFYMLAKQNVHPNLFYIEDGVATYTAAVNKTGWDFFDNAKYGANGFYQKLKAIYLYQPELFMKQPGVVELRELTKIHLLPKKQQEVLQSLFPATPQIQEKVIFFEGSYFGHGLISDEYELFCKIIDKVGKENVIVKRHPFNRVSRYADKGIKEMENVNIPWEIMLLSQSLEGKLLVTVASFTCMSPHTIYGMKYKTMLLNSIKRGHVGFLLNPDYERFVVKVEEQMNLEHQNVWSPRTVKEMDIQLDAWMNTWEVKE